MDFTPLLAQVSFHLDGRVNGLLKEQTEFVKMHAVQVSRIGVYSLELKCSFRVLFIGTVLICFVCCSCALGGFHFGSSFDDAAVV